MIIEETNKVREGVLQVDNLQVKNIPSRASSKGPKVGMCLLCVEGIAKRKMGRKLS